MPSNAFSSFEEALNTIEGHYQQMMQGDLTPEAEAEIRVLLLGLFSTLKAHASRMSNNQTFTDHLEDVRVNIIAWNALGPWFREVKPLVDGVFSLITLGKELLLTGTLPPIVKDDEIDALRIELRDVKDTVKSLIQALEASKKVISQPMEASSELTEPITNVSDNLVEGGEHSQVIEPTKPLLQSPASVIESTEPDESAEDSFMDLISLEARKYAMEKAITTLETEFYEGQLPKDTFEKSMAKQKRELAQILNRISTLRDELEASS